MAQVVNFHDDNNGGVWVAAVSGNYDELFAGQGAYADPGNDIWNGFGVFGHSTMYGSTFFWSGSPGSSGPWPQQYGNPGNPYAAYNTNWPAIASKWVSSSGSSLFDYSGSPTVSGNATSAGQWTPITLSVICAYDNGGIGSPAVGSYDSALPNGSPGFLLGCAALTNGSGAAKAVFTLHKVPAGTYGLYVYGADYDNNRGTVFSVNSGNAHNGIAATLNGRNGAPASTFVEGQNFVIFENVTPDASGNITITALPNPQDGVGNSNLPEEADVNGFQLIFNPPPTAVGSTAAQNVLAGGTANFSFSPAFASNASFGWQSVIGGVTNNLSDVAGSVSGSGTTNLTLTGVSPANVGLYQCVITTATATNTSPAAPLTILTCPATGPLQAGDLTTVVGYVLQPGDTLSDFNNNMNGPYNTVPPPFAMTVANVEDGTLYPYVNFGANGSVAPFYGPAGFTVTPQVGGTVVTGLRLFTAGSHPEDDPADYLLEGSNDGGSTYAPISGGLLALPAQRNAAGGAINITNQVLQEIDFANTTAYGTYRLTFTNVVNNATASNGVQIAEIQLLGSFPAVAPGIAQQPVSTGVLLAGETLHASVAASGAGPFTYQWYFNGSQQVPHATNAALTVTNVQTSGSYTCVVSNTYGPTTSAPLSLTVVTPSLYQATVMADEPLAFWPLSETSGTTAYDYVGGYNGTYMNGPTLNVAGPSSWLPSAAAFDGATNYVLVPNTPALNFAGQITVEAWIQPGTQSDSLSDIVGKGYDTSEFFLRIDNGSSYEGGAWGAAGGTSAGGGTVSQGAWTHLVLTADGVYWNLYVNAVLVGRNASTLGEVSFADPWGIADGTSEGNTRYFAGSICAAAIYSYALTPSQVAAHYGAGGGPPVITAPPLDSVVIINSNVTFSVTAEGNPPLTYQWYHGSPSASTLMAGSTKNTLVLTNVQASANGSSYYVVVTDGYGLAATNAQAATLTVVTAPLPGSYFASVLGLNPLAYWPLSETNQPTPLVALNIGTLGAAGNAFYAGSGVSFQQHGALADQNPADTNYAIATDGVTGSVTLPYSMALSNPPPFTVEAWLQSATTGTTGCPLSCVDANNPSSGWAIYMDNSSAGFYNFRTYNKNGTATSISFQAHSAVTSNTWHHLAVVVSINGNPKPNTNGVYPAGAVTAKMYLDGNLSSTSAVAGYGINDTGAFTIGARSDGSYHFAGEEDEVAFYTNALSASTIAAHYAAGTNTAPAMPYYQVVQQSNPLLFYQLDELISYPSESSEPLAVNYGATGANDNGYYLPGTFPAAVPGPNAAGFPGTGANNRAVSFNHNYWSGSGNPGLTGFIDVPYNTGDLNLLGPITMAAWIQAAPTDGRTGWECFFGRGDSSCRLQMDDTANLLQFGDGGLYLNGIAPAGNINDGKWHFVVGAWDGATASLYVDGILNASNANTGIPAGSTSDLTIGESPDNEPNRVFDGNMAEVAVFAYALSPAQVQSLYYSAELAPYITQQPAASLEVPLGGNTTISVAANGTPTLGYQWLNGGAPVSGGEFSGANTATLAITGAALSDAGSYSVAVSNSYGAVTSSVTALSVVGGAPEIETDISPLLIQTVSGIPLAFSVEAVGTEPLYYQWMQNGAAVPGATTSSYSFNALPGTNTYSVTISNAFGSNNSSTAVVRSPMTPPPVISFNSNGVSWTLNEGATIKPSIANNVLTLTDGQNSEATSAFFDTPQYIGGFLASFVYTAGGNRAADGITFCIQNAPAGASAVGSGGGGLGYNGITPSAAFEMNIYGGANGGPGIQVGTEGSTADYEAVPPVGPYFGTAPVSITSGDPIYVQLYYGQNVLTAWLVDAMEGNSYTTSVSLPDLPAVVGAGSSATAYVGFTGGTGGANSIQTVSHFMFSYTTPPVLSVAHGTTAGSAIVSWPVSIATQFMLQESTAVNGPWSNVTSQVVNGQNQVTLTSGSSASFYRLSLQ